jgi:exonuclease VII large subunit
VIWRCNDKYKTTAERVSGGDKCNTGHVTEEGIYKAFGMIVKQLIAQKPEVIAACEDILRELQTNVDLDKRKDRLETEERRIREKAEMLMDRASRELVENFSEAYGVLEKQLKAVNEKLEAVETERRARELKARQCRLYLKKLTALEADNGVTRDAAMAAGFSETFLALVDRVMVGEKLTFVLKDGTEWTVER